LQRVIGKIDQEFKILELPDPEETLLDDVKWGSFDHPMTPAFWTSQVWLAGNPINGQFRLGNSLAEEVAYCLLGGYGTPAEVGLAAANRICSALKVSGGCLSRQSIEDLLREPLQLGHRLVRYRFPAQRAKYLAGSLELLFDFDEGAMDDVSLRDALKKLPGIGAKTASWIVRNRRGSDRVAILDVHIVRACRMMGIFNASLDPTRHYYDLERRFLEFCVATNSRASSMDALMWATMRGLSQKLLKLLDPTRQFGDGLLAE
jgi:thermostable 8-oxoguanine DNA glycosylase